MSFPHRLLLLLRMAWARLGRIVESPEVSLRRLAVDAARRKARQVDLIIEDSKRWLAFGRSRDWFRSYDGQVRISSLAAPDCLDRCPTCLQPHPPGWEAWIKDVAEACGGRLIEMAQIAAAEFARRQAELDELLRAEQAAAIAAWRAGHPDWIPPEAEDEPTLAEDLHRVADARANAECEVDVALAVARVPGHDPREVEELVNRSEAHRRRFWEIKRRSPDDCCRWHEAPAADAGEGS